MTQRDDVERAKLEIVAKMTRKKILGAHHKQPDTIKNWLSKFDGQTLDEAIDELIQGGVVQNYNPNTIQLVDMQTAKNYIRENDDDDDFVWYL